MGGARSTVLLLLAAKKQYPNVGSDAICLEYLHKV